jgi:hypothetical protein
MNIQALLLKRLSENKRRILDGAQMAMGESQFAKFRRLVLDELGQRGFEGELARALEQDHWHGTAMGGNRSCKEGGVP